VNFDFFIPRDILAGTLSNAPFILQLEMEVATELSRRLGEVADFISQNKDVLVRLILRHWLPRILIGSQVR
jgi:hypothetical protein